jgi:hypothetical protein
MSQLTSATASSLTSSSLQKTLPVTSSTGESYTGMTRYHKTEKIGEGTYGIVYKVTFS